MSCTRVRELAPPGLLEGRLPGHVWSVAGSSRAMALCVGVVARCLAERPEVQEHVRRHAGDAAELDLALDEILRIDDPFLSNRRVASHDAVLNGHEVAEGERVILHWTPANRDPERFEDPDLRLLLQELLAATTWIEPGGEPEREEPPLGGYRVAPVILR